jgi:hypothetical protein
MSCPSCNKSASFFRVSFTLQGVSFSKSIKGYSRCEHCGKLLRLTNLNLSVAAQTVAGVAAVGLYALSFKSIGGWIGFTNATLLFFPYLIFTGIIVTYITTMKLGRFMIVQEENENTLEASK